MVLRKLVMGCSRSPRAACSRRTSWWSIRPPWCTSSRPSLRAT